MVIGHDAQKQSKSMIEHWTRLPKFTGASKGKDKLMYKPRKEYLYLSALAVNHLFLLYLFHHDHLARLVSSNMPSHYPVHASFTLTNEASTRKRNTICMAERSYHSYHPSSLSPATSANSTVQSTPSIRFPCMQQRVFHQHSPKSSLQVKFVSLCLLFFLQCVWYSSTFPHSFSLMSFIRWSWRGCYLMVSTVSRGRGKKTYSWSRKREYSSSPTLTGDPPYCRICQRWVLSSGLVPLSAIPQTLHVLFTFSSPPPQRSKTSTSLAL